MLPASDAEGLLACSARLCCAGILVQSLELASFWRELRNHHLLGYHGEIAATSRLRRLLQRSQTFPANLLVLLGRVLAAAACLVLPFGTSLMTCLLGSLFLTQLYYNRRFQLIFSNADHMTLIGLAAVVVGGLPKGSSALQFTALGFLAFQCSLAYVAGGVSKVLVANWRTGSRLIQVFQDSAHRFSPLGAWLARRPRIALLMSWSVIVLELLFPLCLILPPFGFWIFIVAGLMFHAVIAVVMGLPGFLWAFGATYPALYFIHAWILGGCKR